MPISYNPWPTYSWKNELAVQRERVGLHFAELLQDEFSGDHNPWDMLERALVLAGFAIRRMFEKRLVTDRLAAETVSIRIFNSNLDNLRQPFVGESGGHAFESYDFEATGTQEITLNDLANEIIHSSQLMFVNGEPSIPTGLLIASDWHMSKRLLHLTIDEFMTLSKRVLDDTVRAKTDRWDWETGKVHATRD
jgi:hypothetical protein